MLDFIKDVPDAAWAAVVTGVFLTGQNFLNNRRDKQRRKDDAREREADRDVQLKLAAQAREDARAEAWRESRREAHEALIADIRAAQEVLGSMLTYMGDTDMAWRDREPTFQVIDKESRARLSDGLARVEVLGSEAARTAASKVVNHITTMRFEFFAAAALYQDDRHVDERAEAIRNFKRMAGERRDLLNAYVDMVRADLGTAD